MYFKQKLAYMALGCLFTIIGYILASLSGNPVDAQGDKSSPTVIDEIVCRSLRVVNADGKTIVSIDTDSNGGYMTFVTQAVKRLSRWLLPTSSKKDSFKFGEKTRKVRFN